MNIRRKMSWTSWMRDQYLPESMKWNFANMGSLKLRHFETKKLWNQETKKLWNQKAKKLRNHENKKTNQNPINQATKKNDPSTYRLPSSWGTRANLLDLLTCSWHLLASDFQRSTKCNILHYQPNGLANNALLCFCYVFCIFRLFGHFSVNQLPNLVINLISILVHGILS